MGIFKNGGFARFSPGFRRIFASLGPAVPSATCATALGKFQKWPKKFEF